MAVLFRTERKFFKKKYHEFHHMIETDGVSCSLLLLRKDLVSKKLPTMKKDVVVCFGDYEQKQQMKFKEATKGK